LIRLNKFLAKAGIASRRHADLLLQQGRVAVNGQTVSQLGVSVDESKDKVTFDDKPVRLKNEFFYLMLNKPTGYIVSVKDESDREVVMELIPAELRRYVKPVGRLDRDTSGLLLLTNDGELAFRLTHPRYNINKTYYAKCRNRLTPSAIEKFQKGIELEDGITQPAQIEILSLKDNQSEFRITIHEGRKRQVRRMCRAVDCPVVSLKRIAFGPLSLDQLKVKNSRPLTDKEIRALKKAVGL
jgi:23S rRNA pseudouridine2605 synthase